MCAIIILNCKIRHLQYLFKFERRNFQKIFIYTCYKCIIIMIIIINCVFIILINRKNTIQS